MNVQKVALLIVLAVLMVVGFIFISFDRKERVQAREVSELLRIEKKWELPKVLDEVSGIAYLGDDRIAAVQDEDGIIFIYDLNQSAIINEIKFGKPGDYEGIAIVSSSAYVLRSDGTIFEVKNFESDHPVTTPYVTDLKDQFNYEGLCFDKKNNRLLIAAKEKAKDKYKPVFAFNLDNNTLEKEEAYRISFDDAIFSTIDHKKNEKIIRPSEINIHPTSGNVYVLDGVNARLLIMDNSGQSLQLHSLSKKQFAQAEGLTFDPSGKTYISNEGKGGEATILLVNLDK